MDRHFTATGIVLHEGSVLLVEHAKLKWWMPPGGHLDPDEDPVQAVLREVAEETGLACEVIATTPFGHDAVGVLPAPFTILVEDIPDGVNPHQHIDCIYVLRPVSDPMAVRAQEGEVTGVRWVPVDQVGALSVPPELPALISAAVDYAAAFSAV
ncbi:MAG TPA: NUDIX domain-containing protein [Streptosporangiaceae bacterium]|nr:NUDIX domain-containing protein [Streptosporangiaceae bacterium]